MTEDYKSRLLRYFTNNIKEETGIDEPEFTRQNPILKEDIISMLDERFPYGHYQMGKVTCKNSTGEYNGYTVVYGYYYYQTPVGGYANRRGYVMLFDENMNLLQLITEFSSGTPLNYIEKMNIDEEGNFFAVDMVYDSSSQTTVRNRFIMLNNISLKLPSEDTYKVVLRQSYYLQGNSGYMYTPFIRYINKDHSSSTYVFVYSTGTALTLKINVGAENEWKYYPYATGVPVSIHAPHDYYSFWDNEGNLTLCSYSQGEYNDVRSFLKVECVGDGMEIIQLAQIEPYFADLNNFKIINSGSIVTSPDLLTQSETIPANNLGYVMIGGVFTDDNNQYRAIYRMFKINGSTITKVYEHIEEEPVQDDNPIMYSITYNLNGTIFTNFYIRTNTLSDNGIFKCYCALILDDPTKDTTISLITATSSAVAKTHIFDIKNAFNLYTTYFLGQDVETNDVYLTKANIVYNPLNYNGEPYENTNSLIPNQGFLYDSEGIIFARNLYDKVVSGNLTTSIIQIPNTLLNDITILKQELISQTNNVIINNNSPLSKNIYEEILLNFNNTMNISNQNDLSNITYNYNGASKLNNSTSNLADYSNSTMGKYRINYEDTTNEINDLHWYKVGNFYRCKISVYNSTNNITSIDLISNDETMIYQSIDCSDLAENQIYTLYQDVYIDNKIEAQQIYYGEDEVYYGDEQVYY